MPYGYAPPHMPRPPRRLSPDRTLAPSPLPHAVAHGRDTLPPKWLTVPLAKMCPAPASTACWEPLGRESWPYALDEEGLALARHPPTPLKRSIILAGYLTGTRNMHTRGSSFRAPKGNATELSKERALAHQVQALLKRSPGLCAPNVTVHVVHDLNVTSERLASLAGTSEAAPGGLSVTFHGYDGVSDFLGNDRRWALFADVMRSSPWDCAYAIDLSDVAIVRLPPCAALPNRVLYAADGNIKARARKRPALRCPDSRRGSPPAPSSAGVARVRDAPDGLGAAPRARPRRVPAVPSGPRPRGRHQLRDRRRPEGGIRAGDGTAQRAGTCPPADCPRPPHPVRPSPDSVVARYDLFNRLASAEQRMAPGSDMVLWTVEALKYPSLRGYPDGPASLPPWATPHTGPRKVCPDHNCRHSFLRKTRGYYWFGHKVPQGWINEYLRFYQECEVGGGGEGGEEGARRTDG